MATVLVTGGAGFIGAECALALAARGDRVVAVDNFTPYYEPALKAARAERLLAAGIEVRRLDVAEPAALQALMEAEGVEAVLHLAAQAGVRHSLHAPFDYQHANLAGHLSVLEACRHTPGVARLVYASSSSVYGDRPADGAAFKESDPVDRPVSLYAATKRSDELMTQAYAHLYGLAATGLRFFTVYGPWGRPDMAYFSFTRRVLGGEPLELYGEGRMARDFTFVDDVVAGVLAVLDRPPPAGEARILNIGAGSPRALGDLVAAIEAACGRRAVRVLKPMQPGDVTATFADVSALHTLTGYTPSTPLETGIARFVDWYQARYADDGSLRSA